MAVRRELPPSSRDAYAAAIDRIDVAADGRTTSGQEMIREQARAFYAREASGLDDAPRRALLREIEGVLAHAEAERVDLDTAFRHARDAVVRETREALAAAKMQHERSAYRSRCEALSLSFSAHHVAAFETMRFDAQVDVLPVIEGIERVIQTFEHTAKNTGMPESERRQIVKNLHHLTERTFADIPDICEEIRDDYGTLEGTAWVFDEEISDRLSPLRAAIVSALWYANQHDASYSHALHTETEHGHDEDLGEHIADRASTIRHELALHDIQDGEVPTGIVGYGTWTETLTFSDWSGYDETLANFSYSGESDAMPSPESVLHHAGIQSFDILAPDAREAKIRADIGMLCLLILQIMP